jgi:hypothetical protein
MAKRNLDYEGAGSGVSGISTSAKLPGVAPSTKATTRAS